jgi:hypothetical protein
VLTRDPVSAHLAALGRSLHGPSALRGSKLREARDGLDDAAAAYRDAGVEPGRAAALAVRDFGPVAGVAPLLQAELAAAQGKRTTLWMSTALPAMHLLAPLMWWKGPWLNGKDPVSGYWALTTNFDVLSLVASGLAIVLLLGFGPGSRYVSDCMRYSRAIGIGVLVFLAVHGAAGATVFGISIYQWPEAATWPPILVGVPLNIAAFGYAAVTAWRCVKAASSELAAA